MDIGATPRTAARQYTVRAVAGDNYGDLPYNWFIIRGQTLTASPDYEGWGQTTVTVPAGSTNLDVTPLPSESYGFDVEFVKDKQYWQNLVMDEIDADSGVTIENYKAYKGFSSGNRTDIKAVYAFYQKLYLEQPTEYYWCGLTKLAGAPVYAGLSDAWNGQNGALIAGSPIVALLAYQFQTTLIQMNIDIYSDLAWQFEAYRKGGLQALEDNCNEY